LSLTGTTSTLTPTHTYLATGLYTVTLSVTDTFGYVVSDTLQVNIVEAIFAVDVGPDLAGEEGSPITINGVLTDTGNTGPHTIVWDFSDGGTAEDTLTPSHTYADNGSYTVTLTVTNNLDEVVSDSLVVTVANIAPTVTAVADQSVRVNQTFSGILATFTDPGWLDTHTATIDWGDGTVTTGLVDQTAQTVSGQHTFAVTGVYTVTITVTDNDGDQESDTLQVTVEPYQLYLPLVVRASQ
jgi:PKD repeat protein